MHRLVQPQRLLYKSQIQPISHVIIAPVWTCLLIYGPTAKLYLDHIPNKNPLLIPVRLAVKS